MTSPDTAGLPLPATEERPHPLTPLVQAWIWLVGIAALISRELIEQGRFDVDPAQLTSMPLWLWVGVALGGLSIALNLWRWWTTRFVVTADELRVEHRGITHESRRIAYQRIQSVEVTQPFAARLIGLAQLTVDVGAGAPVKLQYLARGRATALRDQLLVRAHGRTASEGPDAGRTSAKDDRAPDDEVLITLPPGELLLGAVLSHELLALVAVSAIPIAVGAWAGQILLAGSLVLPLLIAIGGYLSKRVIGQFNYTLAQTHAGLRITRGLTSLSSATVPTRRVQAVRIAEPVLWRRIGRARIDLSILGIKLTGDEDESGPSSIMLPIGRPEAVSTALHALWPGLKLEEITLKRAPREASWVAPLGRRWLAHGWDDQVLVVRSGWWTRTTWVVPHARLQSITVTQNRYESWAGIANITPHVAGVSSTARIVGIPSEIRVLAFDETARTKRSQDDGRLLGPVTAS